MLSNNDVQNKWFAEYTRVIKICIVLFIMFYLVILSAEVEEITKSSDEKVSSEQLATLESQILLMQEMVGANKKSGNKQDGKRKLCKTKASPEHI